ncbi:hypothetical protein PPERSA_04244 [Pseudocohnilembus persalinus]|uniref:Uncharacterized protein n=1 Tax=Pseudocohnilembus persalinus TaxID=266149 RepID=A0A0V0QNS7_PSEPJ|nr:hypothetical protein PPERSA_04244 [Pseudocohnilembus persalinus]|eukprot:KRX03736.1 hypothetical protein PPERSA_04244 [Pseudocohnilembus persalinus]
MSDEIFYIIMRNGYDSLPQSWQFYKKAGIRNLEQFCDPAENKQRPVQNMFYKFVDATINGKFQKIMQDLVGYLESSYKVKVKKIIGKFIIDKNMQINLTGLQELLIDVPEFGM